MESILLFTKVLVAIFVLPALVLGVMIGAMWWKDPSRSIKIGFLGMSIQLGDQDK